MKCSSEDLGLEGIHLFVIYVLFFTNGEALVDHGDRVANGLL